MTSQLPKTISPSASKVLEGIAEQFHVSDSRLQTITEHFVEVFGLGLKEYGHPVAMIPTYVTRLPDGTEKGTFLALDLGGDLIRISEVKLGGQKNATQRSKAYELPKHLTTGEATALFDFIADLVKTFLAEHGLQNETLELGLNFGFPVQKTALNKGKLLSWSKGFAVKNAVGEDVLQLLQIAFDRQGVDVKCTALINDTTATLLSKTYASRENCFLGAIFAMGTNGAYVEDIANIKKLSSSPSAAQGDKMIVNIEWGAFDNKRTVLPSTPYDVEVDQASNNQGLQAFEKLTAEMYLGEITHNVINSLIQRSPPLLLKGVSTPMLDMPGGFITQYMAMIEEASSLEEVKQLLVDQLEVSDVDAVSDQDAAIVKWVCEKIGTRAARLCGCAIAAVLIQSGHAKLGGGLSEGQGKLLMAAEGNLIRFYPGFETRLRQAVASIVGKEVEKRLEIGVVKDGSAVGAALCAWESANKT